MQLDSVCAALSHSVEYTVKTYILEDPRAYTNLHENPLSNL